MRIALICASLAALALPMAAQAAQPGDLSDAAAATAIHAAEQQALALNAHVCIAVLDSSGVLKAFKRMEGAAPGCVDSAIAKGRAAALYRAPTFAFMERANHGEPAIATLPGMVPLGGGVPVKIGEVWMGSVGAAGSNNPNEVKIAQAGADAMSAAKPGQ